MARLGATDLVDATAFLRALERELSGIVTSSGNGDWFVFYDPDGVTDPVRRFPFCTLVTGDRYDAASQLDRDPTTYRVNVALSRDRYEKLFGPAPRQPVGQQIIDTGFDYTSTDIPMPHPFYAPLHWACIVNPGEQSRAELADLLDDAWTAARRAYHRRRARRDGYRPLPTTRGEARHRRVRGTAAVACGAACVRRGHQLQFLQRSILFSCSKDCVVVTLSTSTVHRPRVPATPLRADLAETPLEPLPRRVGGWTTLYADPPWRFVNRTGKVAPEHRRLDRYDTMTTSDISALPVSEVVADNAHLYLWVPNALLPDGLQVMESWGFRYVSNLVWAKRRKDGGPDGRGVGFYFRNVTELVLFGVRGSMRTLEPARRQVNMIETRKREHSRKPDEMYEIIESCSPGPYLELFARYHRTGWTAWGAEASEDVVPRGRQYPAYR